MSISAASSARVAVSAPFHGRAVGSFALPLRPPPSAPPASGSTTCSSPSGAHGISKLSAACAPAPAPSAIPSAPFAEAPSSSPPTGE